MAILVKSTTPKDEKDRWATLKECFNDAEFLYGRKFQIDVCAEPETTKCNVFIAPYEDMTPIGDQEIHAIDALKNDWLDDWWCNPPFSMKLEFIEKAREQQGKGYQGVMLLPYEPATQWWQKSFKENVVIYEPDGRYNFYEIDGVTKKTGVNFASAFVVFPSFKIGECKRVQFNRWLKK